MVTSKPFPGKGKGKEEAGCPLLSCVSGIGAEALIPCHSQAEILGHVVSYGSRSWFLDHTPGRSSRPQLQATVSGQVVDAAAFKWGQAAGAKGGLKRSGPERKFLMDILFLLSTLRPFAAIFCVNNREIVIHT